MGAGNRNKSIVKSNGVNGKNNFGRIKKPKCEASKKNTKKFHRVCSDQQGENAKKQVKRKIPLGPSREQMNLMETIAIKVRQARGTTAKLLGAHVSAAGSLEQSIYNAVSIGCSSFALFVRNQRSWKCPPLEDEVVERFKNALNKYNFSTDHILPHSSYLINPGSYDPMKLKKARDGMLDECERCEKLGIRLYNFHPGSTAGECSRKQCIDIVADTINYIIERTSSLILVIETMAGQGNTVGSTFDEIRQIIDLVDKKERVGVCIDTCHIFAAGYDIRSEKAYQKTMLEFDEIIGFKYLRAVHLNDSKGDLGSKLDRHENIGKGKLKMDAFRFLMNDKRFDGIPMVLETPECDYAQEMIELYKLIGE